MLSKLYRSIQERWRPEDVAREILSLKVIPVSDTRELERLAKYAGHTSMASVFDKADDLSKQLKIASELFPKVDQPKDPQDPRQLEKYLSALESFLGSDIGLDFKNRPNRDGRVVMELPHKGHRAFNKRARLITRMKEKLARYNHNLLMRSLAQIAKSRLACRITKKAFESDVDAAIYIAYITSQLNVRSVFTNGSQKRAFDSIAKMLFARLQTGKANWRAIAMVDPSPEVLKNVSAKGKGHLVGEWFEVMKSAAEILRDLMKSGDYRLDKMIVKRGNDSSTWNEAAGAYNKCRQGWINALTYSNMGGALKDFCPGKALRLMAADVVSWHGGPDGLDPDTKVWNELPKPWEVILDGKRCSRHMVMLACRRCKVEPKKWLENSDGPRDAESAELTPELVYGVSVGSPELAKILKKAGFFAGPSKWEGKQVPLDTEDSIC
ncbi:MAG: hypothetical protein G01um101419_665 [Parcubacteria group bacterium Gr01-1014_19]|nr:MAG: hypothetical protein G01um101419_665 [Parcubacteria group bacterium Gr01-1014_19]